MDEIDQQRRGLELRAHVLAAVVQAVDDREAVLGAVAAAADRDSAEGALARTYGWDEVQVAAVLDLQVHRLSRGSRAALVRHLQEARDALA